jgi:hypothetical protein
MPCRLAPALAMALVACHYSPDYSGTSYRCDDGICPSGFSCVNAVCVHPGAIDGGGGSDVASALPWWDPAFTMRAQLTISEVATDDLATGFPIGLPVDQSMIDPGSTNLDDLRIVYWDATAMTWTELNRYTELGGPTYMLWFDLNAPLASQQSTGAYYLYFGNPSPSAAPNAGSSAFDFYDSFGGAAVDTTAWALQGTPTTTNSDLVLTPGESVRTLKQFTPGHAMAFSLTAAPNQPRFWGGFQRQSDFTDGDPWLIWINRAATDTDIPPGYTPAQIWPETYVSAIGMNAAAPGPPETLDTSKHWYTVQRLVDRIVYKYNEVKVVETMLPATDNTTVQVRLANEGGVTILFGMAHVRKAVWPDPTITIGATEMH